MYGTLISSVTVGAGGLANITFSSIPNTYTDLIIVASLRDSTAGTGDGGVKVQLNGDSAANYLGGYLGGDGSNAAFGATGTTSIFNNGYGGNPNAGTTSNTFGNSIYLIPNYAGSLAKMVIFDAVGETNAASANQSLVAGNWSGTAAVTSVSLLASTLFVQNSTAYLYGVTKGSGGANVA